MESTARNQSWQQEFVRLRAQCKLWLELGKSGIVTLVLISQGFGFWVGHVPEVPFEWRRFFFSLIGMLGVAAGSSALNQIQERSRDALMPRTAGRPLPSGRLEVGTAQVVSAVSMTLGLAALGVARPVLVPLGLAAIFLYNGLYTKWWKPRWAYAAIPGSIPGAMPIWMGFVAANGSIWHPTGLYLFGLLVFWQMPHFWSLAIRYQEDYRAGGFPTLPVTRGSELTVLQISIWTAGYLLYILLAPLLVPVSWVYWAFSIPTVAWMAFEWMRFRKDPAGKWLRFFLAINFSLIAVLVALSLDLAEVYWGMTWHRFWVG